MASDTPIRILDGTSEIARHHRTYDRHQLVLDPAHRQALRNAKRKAFDATPTGRLAQAVPESETLPDLAFAHGESAGSQTAQLIQLLDPYGPVAFLLRRQHRSAKSTAPVAVDLSRHPEAQSIEVRPHDPETYDELAHPHDDPHE